VVGKRKKVVEIAVENYDLVAGKPRANVDEVAQPLVRQYVRQSTQALPAVHILYRLDSARLAEFLVQLLAQQTRW